MSGPNVFSEKRISVCSPEVLRLSLYMHFDTAFAAYGTIMDTAIEEGFARDTQAPLAPMERFPVFTSTPEKGTYNHHSQLAKWRGRFYFAWSNGTVDEDHPGQRILISSSENGADWSEPVCIASGDEDAGRALTVIGLYADDERMVAYTRTEWNLAHAKNPSMSSHDLEETPSRVDAFWTTDGETWREKILINEPVCFFEAPRATAGGRLMTGMSANGIPGVCLWDSPDPLAEPRRVMLPFAGKTGEDYWSGPQAGMFPYGESSWYQTDDGRIWLYHRDESASGYLWIALSEDDGKTWTEPMRSDMPDSMSRVYAGRLADGRYYLLGNSVRQLMDRGHLMLSISDDGATFNRMYQLIAEPTRQRFKGTLKVDGYQYPVGLADGGRLLVGYSVNKEDIACGILDCSKV